MSNTNDVLAEALQACLISPNESDRNLEAANVVDGLFAIARSLGKVAKAIHALGNADAATPMGALEAHGLVVKDAADKLAGAIESLRESS